MGGTSVGGGMFSEGRGGGGLTDQRVHCIEAESLSAQNPALLLAFFKGSEVLSTVMFHNCGCSPGREVDLQCVVERTDSFIRSTGRHNVNAVVGLQQPHASLQAQPFTLFTPHPSVDQTPGPCERVK